ncbi:MAG TPA: GxxExxY protein [Burkholderiales bacterium]|nr:GxxExxY protein [Burkholderiales bacterium]
MEPQINADERRSELNALTEKIIGCAYHVANVLGCGFLERVYENALTIELRKAVIEVAQQYGVQVHYEENIVGEYTADLPVERKIVAELKTTKVLDDIHAAQCLNYLKVTGLTVCLLINFGRPKIEVKRIVNEF